LQRRFLRKRGAEGKAPPQSLLRKASSPKGAPLGTTGNFAATAKSRPLGEGGIAAGDDGRGMPKICITACFNALKKVQNR